MADIQEKEELTNQEAQAPEIESTEENVEDYFNPFADISDEDKDIEEEIKKEDKTGKEAPVQLDDNVKGEIAEIKAVNSATREVSKFVKEHPEFSDMGDELVDLASKAMVKGHSKPVEFAVRNVKSPSYWIDYGRKLAREDIAEVSRNSIGGASMPKTDSKNTDFSGLPTEDFNELVRNIKNSA